MTTAQIIAVCVSAGLTLLGIILGISGLTMKLLGDRISELGARIDTLGTQLGARIDDVNTSLSARMGSLEGRMSQLEGRMTNQEAALRDVVKQTAALEATVVAFGVQLSRVEDRVSALERPRAS